LNDIVIRYDTLALTQQVLERQHGHAQRMGDYIRAQGDIGDATGLLLSVFDPLSRAAVQAAGYAMDALASLEQAAAAAVGETARDFRDQDGAVGDFFTAMGSEMGVGGGAAGGYPDLGGPTLPAAGESADADHGEVNSWVWEKGADTVGAVGDGVDDARRLVDKVKHGGGGPVREAVDATSYLVAPSNPENPVQDLRWSAGAILGGIDWAAEQFLGYSILDRCIYHPFAGDWEAIFRASEAWGHCGDACFALARNHAALVASTAETWQGGSGHAFRASMTSVSGGALGMQYAMGYAGDLVKNISTACKLAATGIGMALNFIVNKLLKLAAEAATPVIGWAVGAVTAYSDIEGIIKKVKLIYTIIETIASAIEDFAEGRTALLDKYDVIADLVQGFGRSATA
jgi:hypothetical protein